MSKIRVLDEITINQIAAGEVIENPSSVVKELVENSIDAKATEIFIEIKTGGRSLIRITDNGIGMTPDDALLALERHATSKIQKVEDLHSIYTMGFRGEALPSIASISQFTLITNALELEGKGTLVLVDGGKILQQSPVVREKGTTIEVKNLFFNVPVRKKFQKSPHYDVNEILKVVTLLSLGYPEIKFQLISDQEVLLKTSSLTSDPLSQRMKDVLGLDFFESVVPVKEELNDFKVTGFIGLPSFARHNRSGQFLFINKRAVVSPLISYTIKDCYGSALFSQRHPIFLLHMTVPGSYVDVNVHPQKKEVRLRQEEILKNLLKKAVESTLKIESTPSDLIEKESFSFSNTFNEPLQSSQKWVNSSPLPMQILKKEEKQELALEPIQKTNIQLIGSIKSYILLDGITFNKEGLSVVDQRLAHFRINYEKLLKDEKKIQIQSLLIPYTFSLTPVESAFLEQHLESIHQLGISLNLIGPHSFSVDALPSFLAEVNIRNLIDEILKHIGIMDEHSYFVDQQKKAIALVASKMAITTERYLQKEEAYSLVKQLLECENPYFCPLGKSIVAHISYDELEKRFKA